MSEPEVTSDTPTPRVSPLGSLKERRKEIQNKLWIDLRVPRWENPIIVVRYAPLDPTLLGKLIEQRAKKETSEQAIWLNCDILVRACMGIYAIEDGDFTTKYSLRTGDERGVWTKFDPDLAHSLMETEAEAQNAKAVNVVRTLYITDGDIVSAAQQVITFSGQASEKIAEDF